MLNEGCGRWDAVILRSNWEATELCVSALVWEGHEGGEGEKTRTGSQERSPVPLDVVCRASEGTPKSQGS